MCNMLCIFTCLVFFVIELNQIKKESFVDYISDPANFIDLSTYALYAPYCIIRLIDSSQVIIPKKVRVSD